MARYWTYRVDPATSPPSSTTDQLLQVSSVSAVSPVRTASVPGSCRGREVVAQRVPADGLAGVEHPRRERPAPGVRAHPHPVDRDRRPTGVEVGDDRAHLARDSHLSGVHELTVDQEPDRRRTPLDAVGVPRTEVLAAERDVLHRAVSVGARVQLPEVLPIPKAAQRPTSLKSTPGRRSGTWCCRRSPRTRSRVRGRTGRSCARRPRRRRVRRPRPGRNHPVHGPDSHPAAGSSPSNSVPTVGARVTSPPAVSARRSRPGRRRRSPRRSCRPGTAAAAPGW
jgi:hypothetical protein